MRSVLDNKLLLSIVAILLLANIAMLIFFVRGRESDSKEFRHEKSRSPMTVFLQEEIGFSPEQMASYDALRQENRKKMKPLSEDIRQAKIQFFHLLERNALDTAVLNQAASRIGEKQKEIELQVFKNFRSIRTLCNEEQLVKYDSLVPATIEKMWFAERRGNGRQKPDSLIRK